MLGSALSRRPRQGRTQLSTMAGSMRKPTLYLILISGLLMQSYLVQAQGTCDIHPSYVGEWYSIEMNEGQTITVTSTNWGEYTCQDKDVRPAEDDAIEGRNSTMLMVKQEGSRACHICLTVFWRTPNVLQYHMSDCLELVGDFNSLCGGRDYIPSSDEITTAFRVDQVTDVDCDSTFDGEYGFTYETPNGLCDSPNNTLTACEDVGSSYIANNVFRMRFGDCPDVSAPFREYHRYYCLGSWYGDIRGFTYKFAAIADTVERDNRERFKCLITLENQDNLDNTIRWGMSRFSTCASLSSLYDVPFRFLFHRVPPYNPLIAPQSNLPSSLSGSWLSGGYPVPTVYSVNDTHIHVYPKCTPGTPLPENAGTLDFYLSCKNSSGTRFMMSKYFLGKCDSEMICYDISFVERGLVHVIIGRPYRYTAYEVYLADQGEASDVMFEQVCNDQVFERNSTERGNHRYLQRSY